MNCVNRTASLRWRGTRDASCVYVLSIEPTGQEKVHASVSEQNSEMVGVMVLNVIAKTICLSEACCFEFDRLYLRGSQRTCEVLERGGLGNNFRLLAARQKEGR
jgi:hypothetical protein